MGNIYEEKNEALHEVLSRADQSENGATLLIPDLQRPYVWTPNQVTLLLDSLIRGWPFGTLLLWAVKHEDMRNIPSRTFWNVVDRTDADEGAAAVRRDPPGKFHMVLDGQQRVQSLLLALGGDGYGFKLEDRDWADELQDRRPRGKQVYKHWSKASLCFDVTTFLNEYQREGKISQIEFQKALQWVITDTTTGQSTWDKRGSYQEPLHKASEAANKGRFVRMSRLWKAAVPNTNYKEKEFKPIVTKLLEEHGTEKTVIQQAMDPMAELMTTLRDVKLSKIVFLELKEFDQDLSTREAYDDAIVNIFTRLNTAGRTLTREEITFAWLKTGWDESVTQGQSASECFDDLLEKLEKLGLQIELEDLISGVSFVWASSFHEGSLLSNKDLLKGDIIRPMAQQLSQNWKTLSKSIEGITQAIFDRDFAYRTHYQSVNALAVLWTWQFIVDAWLQDHGGTAPQRDSFNKNISKALNDFVDRWIFCSQWAGRWSGSGGSAMIGYSQRLAILKKELVVSSHDTASQKARDHFEKEIISLINDAENEINRLQVDSREKVRAYYTPLWLWHRLDEKRWSNSKVSLRVEKKKKKLRIDVDHIVSVKLFETKLSENTEAQANEDLKREYELALNEIGNCLLLETEFNLSKLDSSLDVFLNKVHEFKNKLLKLEDWASALAILQPQLSSKEAKLEDIIKSIGERTRAIRSSLQDFIRGKINRVDIE